MPGANLIQSVGGQAQKQTHFTSIFTSRFFLGMFTNRNLLRGPLNLILSDFYHAGTTDVLCDGLNSELFVQLTMIRRPGNPKFSTASVTGVPDSFYGFHRTDGTVQVVVDTTADVELLTPTSNTSLFTKAAGAGEGYFQGVLNTLYMADGVDLLQYTPDGNTNPLNGKQVWNWGGPAPTIPPKIQVVSSGFGAPPWTASVWYSTMGIIKVTTSGGAVTLQQLTSVNANPSNPNTTQIGTSGTGEPVWNFGGNTTDNTVTWETSSGPVGLWKAHTAFPFGSCIWDPSTNGIYVATRITTSTTGGTYPTFQHSRAGSVTDDNGLAFWVFLGIAGQTLQYWQPGHTYSTAPLSDMRTLTTYNSAIITPVAPTAANIASGVPPIYVEFVQTGGTSASSTVIPNFSSTPGYVTSPDGQLAWTCIGLAAYPSAGTPLLPWTSGTTYFSSYVDSNGNLQICIVGGVAAASQPASPSTVYGSITPDGNATWVNCGPIANSGWIASSKYYLPAAGFAPPQGAIRFGGAEIVDSNNYQEICIASGFSGNAAPSWTAPTTAQPNPTTADNTGGGTDVGVTWYNAGPLTANSLTWTSGFAYAYSWKSRTSQDVYSYGTTVASGSRQKPNLQTDYLPAPNGALTGDVTTASPFMILNTPNTAGGEILVTVYGTLDPQYDTIEIYRSVDGGQQGTILLYLTDVAMPPPNPSNPGGVGSVTITDYMPDLATAALTGLDPLIEAPIAHQNDPPPGQLGSTINSSGLKGIVYHQGRLWGFVGSTVYASGGPDTNPGNGFDAWPPQNNFPFQSSVVKLLPTTAGLLVFTTTDLYFIGGGPVITTYYSQLFIPGLGISSPNAVTIVKGLPYVFTSDRQCLSIDPSSGGLTRVGHPIGDKLNAFNPANAYLTYHSYGDWDHALFLGDGATGWWRCDPTLAPDSDTTGPVWSPFASVNGGFCGALTSIETSPGFSQLLIGDTRAGQYVLARDSTFSIFTDGGAPSTGIGGAAYDSFFTMGNIVLCSAGQMAEMDFIEMDFTRVGTQPTVSILFDELSATNGAKFEKISGSFISDPPKLYGPTATPATMWMNRYYFGQTTTGNTNDEPVPAWCKFFQLKVDFGNDTVMNQCLSMTVFGALWQEK